MNHLTEEIERWLPVVGYEGRYEVSNHGRVRSVARIVPFGKKSWRQIQSKQISQHIVNRNGVPYAQVGLWIGIDGKAFKVHRLVLEAFIGPRGDGFVCCHNNGTSLDNRLENLRWDTSKANAEDRRKHGRDAMLGERNMHAKLSEANVVSIRNSRLSALELSGVYGVTRESIYNIRKGATWRHV